LVLAGVCLWVAERTQPHRKSAPVSPKMVEDAWREKQRYRYRYYRSKRKRLRTVQSEASSTESDPNTMASDENGEDETNEEEIPEENQENRGGTNNESNSSATPSESSSSVTTHQDPTGDTYVKIEDADLAKGPILKKATFHFEFIKADIMDVIKAMANITQQNFIVPERIKGQRITILSPAKITAAEAHQVFYTALSANSISVVRVGKFYKLVDAREAMKDTIPTCVDDEPGCARRVEQMVTEILHVHHADASQVAGIIKAMLSKDGDINVFTPSNSIIVSEYSPNLQRLRRIIDALDIPNFDDKLQLVQIQYSLASEIAAKITQIFELQTQTHVFTNGMQRPMLMVPNAGQAQKSMNPDDSDVQISKIVADDRTNQLVIKANRRSFDTIRRLIARLDVPVPEGEQGKIHVYYLENAKAEELSATLSSLTQGASNKASSRSAAASAPVNPPPAEGAPARPSTPLDTAALFEGDVKITADKATNSLLILSSSHDYRSMRALIEKLDVPRRQVYVEAAILEVNLNDEQSFGLDYHLPIRFREGDLGPLPVDSTSLGFVQSAQNGSSPSPTFSALLNLNYLLQATGGAVGGLFGKAIPLTLADGTPFTLPAFGIILKWLQTSTNTNVLSTPHILTTDNEKAHIEVGEKIPFNSGLFGGAAAGGLASGLASGAAGALGGGLGGGLGALGSIGLLGGLNSVQRIDVSLKLTLTPQINESNTIRLEIDQSVEDVVGGPTATTQTPTTAHRGLKTVVVVEDQQTVVLGGLIRDRSTAGETKIPFLGDIPVLGYFFKQHNNNVQKVNLLLVLTPYIIAGPNDFQRIFERKMRENEEFAAEYYGPRKEYRAHIDYQKKQGPLGHLHSILQNERNRIENGGDGNGAETLIAPDNGTARNKDIRPDTAEDSSSRDEDHQESPPQPEDSAVPEVPSPGPRTEEPTTPEQPEDNTQPTPEPKPGSQEMPPPPPPDFPETPIPAKDALPAEPDRTGEPKINSEPPKSS
jgi:general secretion pathway protein D